MNAITVSVTFMVLFAVLISAVYRGYVAVLRRVAGRSAARGHAVPLRAPS